MHYSDMLAIHLSILEIASLYFLVNENVFTFSVISSSPRNLTVPASSSNILKQ